MCSTNRKDLPPIPPLSLCGGEGWIADSEVDYEIGSPIPCFSLNTVSGYCKLVRKTERGKAYREVDVLAEGEGDLEPLSV
jgi:hypothetical protein